MKRNLVATLAVGDFHSKLAKITHPRFKEYADKIGADFKIIEGDSSEYPHYLKFKIKDFLKEYDRVLYLDTDIVIRKDSPNIFDEVPDDCLGIFEEGQFTDRVSSMHDFLNQVGVEIKKWNKKYYNTGVMVFSKCHSKFLIEPINKINHFYEQSYLNLMISLYSPKIHNLKYIWNRMYLMDKITGEQRFSSYFIHYAGCKDMMGEDNMLSFIRDDIDTLDSNHPSYDFKKNILISLEGGLGDQIDCEPVIRYIRDHVYKDSNFCVVSDFPDFFNHLGLKIYSKTDKFEDVGFYEMRTLKGPDHPSWEYMSHPLVHTTDFAALQTIRSTLPIFSKDINLTYSKESLENVISKIGESDLRNYILVHPGRGWDSKTFPKDIWQSYIDSLIDFGKKVVVIGRRISKEQGIVEVDTSRCVDLVDKISYNELVAIIATCPVLLSNDSAPIHIAGAFDNWIGVISTCKRPDHILPYRKGSPFYKAESLEEYKLYDHFNSQPTQVYGATIDLADEETVRKCCPPPSKIIDFVKKCSI